jgi:hypothetical protein
MLAREKAVMFCSAWRIQHDTSPKETTGRRWQLVGYSYVGNRIKNPPTRFLFPRFFHTFASDGLLSRVRDSVSAKSPLVRRVKVKKKETRRKAGLRVCVKPDLVRRRFTERRTDRSADANGSRRRKRPELGNHDRRSRGNDNWRAQGNDDGTVRTAPSELVAMKARPAAAFGSGTIDGDE